jgi:DNA-binding NarL/FixJ family response regulator
LVILISAHDSSALRNKATRLGAAGYLAKPFEGTALVSEIDRLAEASRARRFQESG